MKLVRIGECCGSHYLISDKRLRWQRSGGEWKKNKKTTPEVMIAGWYKLAVLECID